MIPPITPPPSELIEQWAFEAPNNGKGLYRHITIAAARWGWVQRGEANEAELQQRADQELEECLEHLSRRGFSDADILGLRAARRPTPKPPSLKEQALNTLDEMSNCMRAGFIPKRSDLNPIRQALEALPND